MKVIDDRILLRLYVMKKIEEKKKLDRKKRKSLRNRKKIKESGLDVFAENYQEPGGIFL
jgi:hypothetical protein